MTRNALRRAAFLIVLLASLVSGCAGTVVHMKEMAANQAPSGPPAGKAMVVFMRPSGLGFAVQSTVYEVRGNDVALIGVVAAKTKVAYVVDPGMRLFMVIGENADFMSADLLPNRTYYARVGPRLGLWKARFGLEPVPAKELGSASFESDLRECRWVEKTPSADAWLAQNLDSVQSKRLEYYADWAAKPAAEKPALVPGDGK